MPGAYVLVNAEVGAEETVLERIKQTGDVFMAWSDREWILDGAAVHVSIVGFGEGKDASRTLDGKSTERINADLTSTVDASRAGVLRENQGIAALIG